MFSVSKMRNTLVLMFPAPKRGKEGTEGGPTSKWLHCFYRAGTLPSATPEVVQCGQLEKAGQQQQLNKED